ncbi:MAG: hypothetical protein WCO22_16800 [Betaproteobacteria bacterium]
MRFFAVALCAVLLAACSGGGGSGSGGTTTAALVNSFGEPVSNDFGGNDSAAAGADGTAGDGAPIPNAAVTVRDSTGKTVTGTTNKDGYYQLVVTGFTAPMIASVVRSDGTVWYSPSIAPVAARKFVTINLNALTDKVAADVAKASGATGGAAGLTTTMVNTTALQKAKTDLVTQLNAKIVAAGLDPKTFDPVTTPFKAVTTDSYDKLLESVVAVKDPATGETVVTATTTAETKPALQLAKDFLASYDASRAVALTAAPQDDALHDDCYLDNGWTKALARARYTAAPGMIAGPINDVWVGSEANKYLIGSTRSNISVLSDTVVDNADLTNRRLIKVQYQVNYTDGTTENNATATLISGSSYGATLADGSVCTTPTVSKTLRHFGNREIVRVGFNAYNYANVSAPLSASVPYYSSTSYTNAVGFKVRDPGKVATYAIVKGAGLPTNGALLLSPSVMRDDAAFGNIRGKYVDWGDGTSFKWCRDATGKIADAASAACLTYGASGSELNKSAATAEAADVSFATLNLTKGSQYTFDIYKGNGWKTVGGYKNDTPIASYSRTLNNLPYSAAAVMSAVQNQNQTPWTTNLADGVLPAALRNNSAISFTVTTGNIGAIPLPDATKLGWSGIYLYREGKISAGQTSTWPMSQQEYDVFPANGATTINISAPAPSSVLAVPTYGSLGFELTNRNGNYLNLTGALN